LCGLPFLKTFAAFFSALPFFLVVGERPPSQGLTRFCLQVCFQAQPRFWRRPFFSFFFLFSLGICYFSRRTFVGRNSPFRRLPYDAFFSPFGRSCPLSSAPGTESGRCLGNLAHYVFYCLLPSSCHVLLQRSFFSFPFNPICVRNPKGPQKGTEFPASFLYPNTGPICFFFRIDWGPSQRAFYGSGGGKPVLDKALNVSSPIFTGFADVVFAFFFSGLVWGVSSCDRHPP